MVTGADQHLATCDYNAVNKAFDWVCSDPSDTVCTNPNATRFSLYVGDIVNWNITRGASSNTSSASPTTITSFVTVTATATVIATATDTSILSSGAVTAVGAGLGTSLGALLLIVSLGLCFYRRKWRAIRSRDQAIVSNDYHASPAWMPSKQRSEIGGNTTIYERPVELDHDQQRIELADR